LDQRSFDFNKQSTAYFVDLELKSGTEVVFQSFPSSQVLSNKALNKSGDVVQW